MFNAKTIKWLHLFLVFVMMLSWGSQVVDAAGQKYMAEKGMVRTIVPENLINKTSVQPGIKLAARKDIPAKSEAAKWNFTSEEMRLFAQLVHAEANGEPYSGKVAVAAAILNRIECEEYPCLLYTSRCV